jgi:hypothetical protein
MCPSIGLLNQNPPLTWLERIGIQRKPEATITSSRRSPTTIDEFAIEEEGKITEMCQNANLC